MTNKEKDKQYIANTYARQDVLFCRGEGSCLFDENGKKYIDFGSGIAVNGLGYNNKPWAEAVAKQAAKLAHTSNLYYSEPCIMLAEELSKRTGLCNVFFANSGAEANECAIKSARKYGYDKKGIASPRIITLKNSFHGRTLATLTATAQDSIHKPFFMPFIEGFDYVEANNIDALKKAVSSNTCAVMLELIQGEGGVMPLDKEYVLKVWELCKQKDILLIADEVQTGNGRTGTLYAYMQFGILPDIVTTAKGLGNGLPLGVCMFGEKTRDILKAGDHGSTFGANPVACAGALAVLKQLDKALFDNVISKHQLLVSRLKAAGISNISGMGFMLGIEVPDAKEAVKQCLEKGLVVLTAHEKLRLLPPLNISDEDFEAGIKILIEVLK